MKNLFLFTSALLFSFGLQAQHLHGSQRPLTPHQQQLIARTAAFSASPATAQKGASTQKERVKSIFVNFGGGDDSVVLYYGSPFRGSHYNYAMFDQLYGYDAGYSYLQGARNWMKYDSLIYITRNDHVSPYMPYFKSYLQYPADSSSLENYARSDRPDAMGNYTAQGTAYRFDRLFAADGSLIHEYDYQYDAGIAQYDTTSVIRNSYYAPGQLLTSQNYYFTTPYPNIGFGQDTVNYYTAGGKLYRTDVFDFNTATNSFSTTPANTYTFTYNAAGKVASQTWYNAGTAKSMNRYTYNSAGQKITDSLFKYKPSQYSFNDTANAVISYTYASPTATDYATLLSRSQIVLAGGYTVGPLVHTTDSIVQTFDASGQVIHYQENYDYDPYGTSPDVESLNVYVTFATPGKPSLYRAVDVYEGDIIYYNTALTFNSEHDPLTRTVIQSADFGSTGMIDTFSTKKERYTYEHYLDPTAVGHTITAKPAVLKVFPNPATSELRLSCADMKAAQMSITNSNGQTVRSYAITLGGSEAVVPVSDLSPGLYFVVLRNEADGSTAAAKFLKQ